MSALDRAIRERLDQVHEDWCDRRDPLMAEDERECNCRMGTLAGALRAVLDVHKVEVIPNLVVNGEKASECVECGWLIDGGEECPTKRAIAVALHVEVPGGAG